jgi:hypothetical protein
MELPLIDFGPRLIVSFAHLGRTAEPKTDPARHKTVRGYKLISSAKIIVQCGGKFPCPQLSTALKQSA